jgi:glyoxylase-like metal-dependent hydrolase (beta-lactamase superfamily II)
MITVHCLTFNAFGENTYILADETNEAVIIDPGCYDRAEEKELVDFLAQKKLTPKAIINTHCHIDHVLGAYFCKNHFKIPFLISAKEKEQLEAVKLYAPVYGFNQYKECEADSHLPEEGHFNFGASTLKILFVPGHSPGHLIFYAEKEAFCIAGDVIFKGSIGRTDLPGGNHDLLLAGIKKTVFRLPENVVIYSGHGEKTNVGFEKKFNPFVKDDVVSSK